MIEWLQDQFLLLDLDRSNELNAELSHDYLNTFTEGETGKTHLLDAMRKVRDKLREDEGGGGFLL